MNGENGGAKIQSRRDLVFMVLAGFFVTNAILGELTGGKLIEVELFGLYRIFGLDQPFVIPVGLLPWPVIFITTDLINEYFGKNGVKRLSLMTVGMISYAFIFIFLAMRFPAVSFSTVTDSQFNVVFGQSKWIIVGSVTAFLVAQLVDVGVFWFLRHRTGGKMLWLRATGSTLVSQLIDTVLVQYIAFWLPFQLRQAPRLVSAIGLNPESIPQTHIHDVGTFARVVGSSYSYKFLIAVLMTPVIYAVHGAIDKYLGEKESHKLIEDAAHSSDPGGKDT